MTPSALARLIVDVLPSGVGSASSIRADQLALCLAVQESPRTVSWLVQSFGVSQATASEIVQRGIARGLVEVARDPGDRRRTIVSPTAKATRLLRSARRPL